MKLAGYGVCKKSGLSQKCRKGESLTIYRRARRERGEQDWVYIFITPFVMPNDVKHRDQRPIIRPPVGQNRSSRQTSDRPVSGLACPELVEGLRPGFASAWFGFGTGVSDPGYTGI
jgi:hypothetical protein